MADILEQAPRMIHQQLQDRLASRGREEWPVQAWDRLGAAQKPPPRGVLTENMEARASQADTTGQRPGHAKILPSGPLAIPCFPESHPKHAFKMCVF